MSATVVHTRLLLPVACLAAALSAAQEPATPPATAPTESPPALVPPVVAEPAEPPAPPPDDSSDTDGARRPNDPMALRDPFWVVGWQPPTFGLAIPTADNDQGGIRKWQNALRRIEISGLIRTADGSYLANVKGVGVVETGDLIWVDYDAMTYKWRVRAITKKGIVPERVSVTPSRNVAAAVEGGS